MGYSPELRNAKMDAITTVVGNTAKLEIYSGTKPATGGSEGTLLASFTCATPFAPGASAGVLSPTLPSATTAVASGTAGWARLNKTDGTTYCIDLTVGTSAAQVILNTLTIVSGGAVSITSWTITDGNP
jgi:hypothetical protein